MIVLDTYALIAFFQDEPGGRDVRRELRMAERGRQEILLSLINFGEFLYMAERRQGRASAQQAVLAVDTMPITVIEPDRKLVFEASHLKATHPISYADAFAAALAIRYDAPVMTGDPEFKALEREVPIRWLPAR